MTVRTNGVLTHRNASSAGNNFCHFAGRQNSSFSWFGTLRELNFKHFYGRDSGDFRDLLGVKIPMLIPNAIFGGTNLKDQITRCCLMKRRQSALASVQPDPGLVSAR